MAIKKLCPFKLWTLQNFPFIAEDFDALTNYELMCKIVEYLNNVISVTNEQTKAINEMKEYFDNLDVQEEVNNKLDKMAESGQLSDIIAQYLELQGLLCYNTTTDLINADNVADGSFCKTFGHLSYNDGKGSLYKIRTITNEDVIDGYSIIALENFESLVAELVDEKPQNIRVKNYYQDNTNIYVVELKNISSLEVMPSNGNIESGGDLTNKNVSDFVDSTTTNYDIYLNSAVGQANTGKLIGYAIYNGVGYASSVQTSDTSVVGFKNNLDMVIKKASDTDLTDLESLGVVNAFTCFDSLIINGEDVSPITTATATIRNCLAQLEDKTIVLIVAYCRKPLNENISWEDLRTFVRELYPTVKNLCVLDGGGSAQIQTKEMSLIPSTDCTNYLGRPVPVILGIKVKEEY